MKKLMAVIAVLCAVLSTQSAMAEGDNFGVIFGYRGLALDEVVFSHDTHPSDSFLANSGKPGSAGTTSVGGDIVHYLCLGLRYQKGIASGLALNIDLAGLVSYERDEEQNDNDTRPASQGSFVYSSMMLGGLAGVGVMYYVGDFFFGVYGQYAGIYESHGWNRYGEDDSVESEMKWYPSLGPALGYRLSEGFDVEATLQFGEVQSGSFMLVVHF